MHIFICDNDTNFSLHLKSILVSFFKIIQLIHQKLSFITMEKTC